MSLAPVTCKISIRGSYDLFWADYLGDMVLRADVKSGEIRTTTLLGEPPDLAAFIGMISLLADLGFPVIDCEYHQVDGQEIR